MTDKTIEQVILALQVIGSIREKDRVYTSNNTIAVYAPNKADCVYRWWNSENRQKNLDDIKSTLDTSFTLIDGLMATEEVFHTGTQESKLSRRRVLEITKNQQSLHRLNDALQKAKIGLENLKATYDTDVTTQHLIGLLINNIEDKEIQIIESKKFFNTHTHIEVTTELENTTCIQCKRMINEDINDFVGSASPRSPLTPPPGLGLGLSSP